MTKLPVISSPTYTETLPSGLVVRFRPFLVKEHKVLLTLRDAELSELSETIRELVQVCVQTDSIDVSKLAHFDVAYLFLKIRAKSIGENVSIRVKCDCGNSIDTEYSIDDLKIRKTDSHSKVIMLDAASGVGMKYPSLDSAIALIDDEELDIVPDCIEYIVSGEDIIYAEDIDREELLEWLDSLSFSQFALIESFFKTSPTIVQEIDTDCDKCGNHIHTEITSLYNFFF